jgi:hypothetical protein
MSDHRLLSFDDFRSAAPALAEPILARLQDTRFALIGTVRKDGSPRVSPIEVGLHEGRLAMGMMPGSAKMLDVVRDPRACLITPVVDRMMPDGEGKLFGRIEQVGGEDGDRILRAMVEELEGASFEDLEGSPVFEFRIGGAAWQHVDGDTFDTLSWGVGGPVRHRRRVGATGLAEDVDR